MKKFILKSSLVAGAAIAVVLFVLPSASFSYKLLGGSLGISTIGYGFQRDVRAYNNASDSAANNNVTPDAGFPGALGASLAVWRGAAQWNSDNTNAGKNFDIDWQGDTTSAGGMNGNTVSWTTSSNCSGGVIAYTYTPISDGWQILMCENWTWSDGPGTPGSYMDIEGIMTHEYGHALGLDHTSIGCGGTCSSQPTMCAYACSNGYYARTIENDDASGLQAIYGSISSGKPTISAISGQTWVGGKLIITGTGFDATVNVKFTAGTSTATGTISGVAYNVPTSGGGTQVTVTIPTSARTGHVHVWEPATGLSNGYPIQIGCPAPTNYGTGEYSSLGTQALITANGSFTAPSQFSVDLSGGRPDASALLLRGQGETNTPTVLGRILVGSPGYTRTWTTTDASGKASVNVNIWPGMVGLTYNFQYAVRDSGFGGGVQLSNAVKVTYCP